LIGDQRGSRLSERAAAAAERARHSAQPANSDSGRSHI
jgi:hypothetical protein